MSLSSFIVVLVVALINSGQTVQQNINNYDDYECFPGAYYRKVLTQPPQQKESLPETERQERQQRVLREIIRKGEEVRERIREGVRDNQEQEQEGHQPVLREEERVSEGEGISERVRGVRERVSEGEGGVVIGMSGVVTLPILYIKSDIDNPSVYMGGTGTGYEIDAGLSWSITEEGGPKITFRPFWRTNIIKWANAPSVPQYYYYPGDTLLMSFIITGDENATLTIAPINSTRGQETFSVTFYAQGFCYDNECTMQFKRVNSIDQEGNEGKPVIPTKTVISNAIWHSVDRVLSDGTTAPLIISENIDMKCPNITFIHTMDIDVGLGAEAITLGLI